MSLSKEIVIYINQPYSKFRWLGVISTVQIGFVMLNFILMPTNKLIEQRAEALKNRVIKKKVEETEGILDEYEPNPDYDPATVFQRLKRLDYGELFSPKNAIDNMVSRPILSTVAVGASLLISFALHIYCRRMAHIITLLPNERVRFTSFSPFALSKPPSIEVPLTNISCVQGRKAPTNYSILKIKGYYGYHLVQKQDGKFLEPKLYDQNLGYSRSWAVT
jgi:hypothetical protein